MDNYLNKIKNSTKDWLEKKSGGAGAKFWLMAFSFSEASFFLIPPDFFLLLILIHNGGRWIYYSFLTTITSVLGGVFGYFIGFFFFDLFGQSLIEFYSLQEQMLYVSILFKENAFWTIFVSAFTPIPFKVFTISAGFCKINLIIFILASIIGRALRFFAVAYIVKCFGKQMAYYAFRYFNYLTLLVLVLIMLFLLI